MARKKTVKKKTASKTSKKVSTRKKAGNRKKSTSKKHGEKREIESYEHMGKERANNPPVGLVTPDTDPDGGARKVYAYDPHLDPQLQWAGKAEHTSFEVPTVSLHVHERIDPRTIIESARKGTDSESAAPQQVQLSLFDTREENPPLREAVEFYKHAHGWSNRLIAGDSLLVMNSLLEKEGMAGKVQMVYLDPPYGIKYGSNFQPFVNRRDVKDGKDEDLTAEPEQIRAFRDTWELGIHSYLTYLRDRLLLARELLTESGSVFVQISDENVHHVRELMDEVFGVGNFVNLITVQKTSARSAAYLAGISDYLVMYAKNKDAVKFRAQYRDRPLTSDVLHQYQWVEDEAGSFRRLTKEETNSPDLLGEEPNLFRPVLLTSSHEYSLGKEPFVYEGNEYLPGTRYWSTSPEGLTKLSQARRLFPTGSTLNFKRYLKDFALIPLADLWNDTATGGGSDRYYVVQTTRKVIQRCVLMTTDPGDLVLDPTCGSGTTAHVAEQWGRRWITCDTSRVALTLARQRLMTAVFDYYELSRPDEGVGSGLVYRTVPHITLKSIANNPEIKEGMTREEINEAIARHAPQETLYDQPTIDRKKTRVSGPFTVEAVPAPAVKSIDDVVDSGNARGEDAEGTPAVQETDHFAATTARSGETFRQNEWRDELLRTGIRGKAKQAIQFARLEPLPGCRWLHADGETLSGGKGEAAEARRIVVSFGPEHAPLEQRQVAQAIEETLTLVPKPKLVVFAAFQFDSEAAKDIDETNWPGVTLLKVQMNADLLTDDLKKKRASNESFWLIGQPDVEVVSEQWLVDSNGRMVMPYEFGQVISGFDSLAKINGIDEEDLRLYAGMAQRGDLWADLAGAAGCGVDSDEHRRGSGANGNAGLRPVSGNRAGIPLRIGNTGALIARLRVLGERKRRSVVNDVRRDGTVAQWTSSFTVHKPLTTGHYCQVRIQGFDYYNTKTGLIESGGSDRIAVWMLDTDYDGRSLYPRQVFFPMAGAKDGWARLAKNLKAEIDEERIEAYRGVESLSFEPGEHRRVAVKIVDDRGIESLKILDVSEF